MFIPRPEKIWKCPSPSTGHPPLLSSSPRRRRNAGFVLRCRRVRRQAVYHIWILWGRPSEEGVAAVVVVAISSCSRCYSWCCTGAAVIDPTRADGGVVGNRYWCEVLKPGLRIVGVAPVFGVALFPLQPVFPPSPRRRHSASTVGYSCLDARLL